MEISMNWNIGKETSRYQTSHVTELQCWGKLEKLYNCEGVFYNDEVKKFAFPMKKATKLQKKICHKLASMLSKLAYRIYRLPEQQSMCS